MAKCKQCGREVRYCSSRCCLKDYQAFAQEFIGQILPKKKSDKGK